MISVPYKITCCFINFFFALYARESYLKYYKYYSIIIKYYILQYNNITILYYTLQYYYIIHILLHYNIMTNTVQSSLIIN